MAEEVKSENVNGTVEDESSDVKDNKGMAILAYIIFFIPLITSKDSKFAMYHANQGLVLFLFGVSVSVVGTIIPLIGWLLILPLGTLCWFIFVVLGIINAANGKQKQLPLIGKISLLK